jgi:hypothetical protein
MAGIRKNSDSWRDLRSLKKRGLAIAPDLACATLVTLFKMHCQAVAGALNFWTALRDVELKMACSLTR